MALRQLFGWLFRSRSNAPHDAPRQGVAPKKQSDLDESLDRVMERVNAPIERLKGDGKRLQALIQRIEQTTNQGRALMEKGSPT